MKIENAINESNKDVFFSSPLDVEIKIKHYKICPDTLEVKVYHQIEYHCCFEEYFDSLLKKTLERNTLADMQIATFIQRHPEYKVTGEE